MRVRRHRRFVVCLVIALAAPWIGTRAEQAPAANPRFDALASLAEAKMKEYGVPGVALGIVADGGTTIRGLGVTNVEDPLPVTGHTVFPIASISKTFATTAMMRLVEQGKVDLKAPVRTYLPDFKVRDEAASRDVTVWHLLTHTRRLGRAGVGTRSRQRHAEELPHDDHRPDAGGAAGQRRGATTTPASASPAASSKS